MKVKKFFEEHKKEIVRALTIGTIGLVSGYVGYKIGYKIGQDVLCENERVKKVMNSILYSNALYARQCGPDELKFKDIGSLVEDAMKISESHLEDEVVGFYVMTNTKK